MWMMLGIASLQQIFYFVEYPKNLSPTNPDYPDYLENSNKFQQSQ
jgi:hypothetical protein